MAEIALRTKEFKGVKEKYIAWRPIGSVIVAMSAHFIRRKWLEIVCDLVSPKKRHSYTGIPGYQTLVDHWTQQLWDEWFESDRPTEKYPLGPLLQDKTIAQGLWNTSVDNQLISTLGKEPVGVENITNTWLWSPHERKILFIIFNNQTTDEELGSYGLGKHLFKNGDLIITSGVQYKYNFDVDISSGSLVKIQDPNVICHPRFDIPVPKIKFNTPDTNDLVIS